MLVAERRGHARFAALWLCAFILALTASGAAYIAHLEKTVEAEAEAALRPYATLGERFRETLAVVRAEATAPPCSQSMRLS